MSAEQGDGGLNTGPPLLSKLYKFEETKYNLLSSEGKHRGS